MCVGRVSWGHSLAVGVQLAVAIGLAMKSYCYLLVSVKGTIHDQSTGYFYKIVAKLLNYQLHQISYPPPPTSPLHPSPLPLSSWYQTFSWRTQAFCVVWTSNFSASDHPPQKKIVMVNLAETSVVYQKNIILFTFCG